MDNARDREQVEPLMPPSGCVMLITSRQQFTLPELHDKNLDLLPAEEARELLLKIAPRIGGLAGDLASRCGYLPEALRATASAIAERPDISPADFLERMTDIQNRLKRTGVELSLATSFQLLSADLQKQWLELTAFPDSFDHAAAAAVWQLAPDAAKYALSDLLKYSLVQWNSAADRYRLHDLVRDFTGSHLGKPERIAAQARHAAYYKDVLARADKLYVGGDVLQGLALFDLEWTNIRAGQALAGARAAEDDSAARLSIEYPDAGAYVLDLRQNPRQRMEWLATALSSARRLRDRPTESRALGNLGSGHYSLGEYRRAIGFHEQHLAIAREIGDRRSEGRALGNLGIVYAALGEYRRAIEFHQQYLVIAREVGDRRGEGTALGNLGLAYSSLGEYRRAIEFHQQHLAISREIGDRRGEGAALGNLGAAYRVLGEYRRAIEFHERRLAIAHEIGDRRGEGTTLGNLGLAYRALGEYRRAVEFHEQHLAIARDTGDRRGEGTALGNLGVDYRALGEYRRAIEFHEQQLAIAREVTDRRGEGNALGNLGNAYQSLGEYRRAIEFHEQNLAIVRHIGDQRGQGATLGNLGNAYHSLREYGRATEFHEQQLAIAREIGDRLGEGTALFGRALALAATGEQAQAISSAEQALTILEQIEAPDAATVRDTLAKWRKR